MRLRVLLLSLSAFAGLSCLWGQTETVFVVTGVVRLEDGTPPPSAAQINRVCNGRFISEGRTDSTGHFTFSVDTGKQAPTSGDAAAPSAQAWDIDKALNRSSTQYSNPITTALRDCEVQAVLSGFRTASVALSVHDMSDNGRVGTIVLHPLSRSGELTISATTAAAPGAARRAYDKGMEAIDKSKWDAAESELKKAVALYPKFAIAWYQLGQVREQRNAQPGAVDAWKEACQQDPKYLKPYESLAAAADRTGDWTAAEQYSREWIQLDPDEFPAAYLINAVANARLDRVDVAEKAARNGLLVDKERRVPRLDYVLGLILLGKQQYAESAKYLRTYVELVPNAHDAATVREQIARLDQMAGPPH
ncbi:MAG TPA: tetratricopeptide repeat protein [Bryobacteraceae bacterium]|jgi:tetratricopeptide (TPR) repeat protein|nr:tetratricopeptide repeat protein [Bryobacteraceae bacterium]